MKNLHEQKAKFTARNALAFAILLLQLPVVLGFRYLAPNLFENNSKLISYGALIIFTAIGVLILSKNLGKLAILNAMAENEIRLKTDRKYWLSKNKDVTGQKLAESFKNAGYSVSEQDDGGIRVMKKGIYKTVFDIYEEAENPEFIIKNKTNLTMRASSRYDKRAFACIFIKNDVTQADKTLARDVSAIENGCIMPVFYDATENRAYYMGGETGKSSPEKVLQKELKKHLLMWDDDYPEKTVEEKTDEENDFEKLDAAEILALLKSGNQIATEHLSKMDADEMMLYEDGYESMLFYKHEGIGYCLKCAYNDAEKSVYTDSLDSLTVLMPVKRRPTDNEKEMFNSVAEKFFAQKQITYGKNER